MKLRISRKYIIDYMIWLLLGFYVLVAHWIWKGRGIQEDILIFLSMVAIYKGIRLKSLSFESAFNALLSILLIGLCIYGIANGDGHAYLGTDLKSMVGTFVVAIYFTTFIEKPERLQIRMESFIFKWFNIYTLINSVIILIQYLVPYFMMNRGAINSVGNTAYFDQIVGFFGVNGTTRWGIWTVVLIVLNFHVFFKKRSKGLLWYNISLILANAIISMMNSARSFLIVLPMTLLIYFFAIRRVRINVKMSYVMGAFSVAVIFYLTYLSNGFVHSFIDNLIEDKFTMYLSGDISLMIAGNDDRAVATSYAVQNGGMLGTGIGSIPMHSTNSFVKYLGLNSASSYIHMIGVIGFFLYTILLARLGVYMCKGKDQNRVALTAIYAIYLLISSYLLPVYSSFAILPGIILIFIIFAFERNVINKE